MYKDIALVCRAESEHTEATALTRAVAEAARARVSALCLIPDLIANATLVGAPSGVAIVAPALNALEEDKNRLMNNASELREQMRDVFQNIGSKFEWRDEIIDQGQFGDVAANFARCHDLIVTEASHSDPDGWDGVIERIAMESGRPLLVSGRGRRVAQLPQRIQVSWDGSAEATRALHDALPFLAEAKKVVVVTAIEKDSDPIKIEATQERLIRHLGRHGIQAEADRISADVAAVSDALSSHADDMRADMIVMGAFGGSRIREFLFGSAASNVLSKNRLPVLLSH